MEQAHALPLGDVPARAELAEELARRDLPELARRERELALRLGWGRSWSVNGFLFFLAQDAAATHDYTRAADAYERIVAGVLGSEGLNFNESAANLWIPARAKALRARAALAAGRLEEALAHARACLDLSPGNITVAILLVPELAKRGRTADADSLYARAAAPHVRLCREYPQGALFHNDRAWLAACCRRDLDAALAHARQALELEPHSNSYRDTLAEVYFQRGETAKALELMRECLRTEPQRSYFAKQLRRFEAGDPSVPPPEEGAED